MAKRISIPQLPPQNPPPPANPADAGGQQGLPTATAPFPPQGAAPGVASDMGMNNAPPGPTMNMPVNAAAQTHAPFPGPKAPKAKKGK